jgi:CheY-like chemotaxis protein
VIIAETLLPLALQADQKGLELICDIAANVPTGAAGDPTRLRQVLSNLVGNALKFTKLGHIVVSVREEARLEGRTTLHFSVTDTGIGIAPESHDAIFESFRQADGSTTRHFGGTGLGLTISATLVEMMGGRIWVESEPGVGSTFHFTLALDIAVAPDPTLAKRHSTPISVLIVDDNGINRRILSEQVSGWGMTPTVVEGGEAAISELASAARAGRPFELVLLDANMPGMDGFAVAAAIATHPTMTRATVMMLTSAGAYGDLSRCAELGIAAYLTKPVYAADLLTAIERALGATVSGPACRADLPPRAGGLVRAADAARARVLLVEDNLVNQQVASGLLSRRGHDVTIAQHGGEAVAQLEAHTFDIVLMDLQMPTMGGIEATHVIRARERVRGGHARIVAMTAHAMSGDRERCLEAGMDDYLSKPIDPVRLFALVEQRIEAADSAGSDFSSGAADRHAGELARAASLAMASMTAVSRFDNSPSRGGGAGAGPVAPAAVLEAAFDQREALTRTAGDERLLTELALLFVANLPSHLAAIRECATAGDIDGLQRATHTVRGSAGVFSANDAGQAALALEIAIAADATPDVDALVTALERELVRLGAELAAWATEGMS